MSTFDPLEDALVLPASPSDPPTRDGRRARPDERVCGALGCSAHLSRYNDSTTCWLHGPGADPMRRPR